MSEAAGLERRLGAAASVAASREALAAETAAWIVGGAVRDAALGEGVGHADLAVAPGAEREAARAIAHPRGGVAFPLSEHHPGWRAQAEDWHVDVTPLRAETIEQDLRARDFSVNAIAVPLHGGDPIDPTGGLSDAGARRLRAVSDAAFEQDPLRLLRAPRLAAAHDLEIEPGTMKLARAEAGRATRAAGERQFAELRSMLGGPAPLRALELMDELGLTAVVLPELEATRGVAQNPNHHLDVHGHTLEVLAEWLRLESDPEGLAPGLGESISEFLDEPLADEMTRGHALRFGALFHDLGKPETRGERDGYVTFLGHDEVGAEIIAGICERLRTSRLLSSHLQGLARHHLRLGFLIWERPLSRRAAYDYLRATEPVSADVTLLSAADRLAARGSGPIASEEMVDAHMALAREMLVDALEWHRDPPRPPLDGDELAAELGIEPGPALGEILEELRAASYAGELPDRAAAVALARDLAEDKGA
ncbi:MAG: HD domain-containing protein [Actinobacteria bacterium]|nr:HD domain-containing protein [Actinomycetota bacterium]